MIAIILPTRGLVFTEVEMAIEDMRQSTWMKIKVFRSHDKTIPQGINDLVEQALNDKEITHFLFIEEDTVPPKDAIHKLIHAIGDITFIDYGVNGWSCSARDAKTDEVLWCGLGCTMMRRRVLEALEKPWFRSDKKLRLNDLTWRDVQPDKTYGGQDIWFCCQAREKGFKIEQVKGECRHLRLETLGSPEINQGLHTIIQKPVISKYQLIDIGEVGE